MNEEKIIRLEFGLKPERKDGGRITPLLASKVFDVLEDYLRARTEEVEEVERCEDWLRVTLRPDDFDTITRRGAAVAAYASGLLAGVAAGSGRTTGCSVWNMRMDPVSAATTWRRRAGRGSDEKSEESK